MLKAIGQIIMVINGQMLKKILDIWSHCFSPSPSFVSLHKKATGRKFGVFGPFPGTEVVKIFEKYFCEINLSVRQDFNGILGVRDLV